ncbi:hypothetical protein H2202_005659 [Exophiala xenobiotica]|nr:hypothetical protein H2202_005659 [Exophiala xenobiotica]
MATISLSAIVKLFTVQWKKQITLYSMMLGYWVQILSSQPKKSGIPHVELDHFNKHIYMCLKFGAPFAIDSCMTALRIIRESLILTANWTDKTLEVLCLQLAGEWGGFRVPERFYNVEETNALWQKHGMLTQPPEAP